MVIRTPHTAAVVAAAAAATSTGLRSLIFFIQPSLRLTETDIEHELGLSTLEEIVVLGSTVRPAELEMERTGLAGLDRGGTPGQEVEDRSGN